MSSPIARSKVLVPLYIYPDTGAWDPLFRAYLTPLPLLASGITHCHHRIVSNPTLEFLIIVNPDSGPGSEPWWPNTDYVRDIPSLTGHANVQVVGYVSTDYCKRSIEKVLEDVNRYGTWSQDRRFPGLAVSGIFFDETPNVFSEKAKDFLDTITRHVKETDGILGSKMVIHNPGTAIDARLASPGLDIATVAEIGYSDFKSSGHQNWLATSSLSRKQTSYMIYAVPEEEIEDFVVAELRNKAGYVFVTDRSGDVYSGFGRGWERFIEAMAHQIDLAFDE